MGAEAGFTGGANANLFYVNSSPAWYYAGVISPAWAVYNGAPASLPARLPARPPRLLPYFCCWAPCILLAAL